MKQLFLFLFIAGVITAKAQTVESQVNQQVWLPFIESYNTMDADAFMAVHTDDVVRVNRDGNSIRNGDAYSEAMHTHFENDRKNGVKKEIDLRFLERFYNEDTGYEVGIYRVRQWRGELEQVFYGKFHVLLRKVGDQWKIAVDSDVSNNGMIREEDFMKGEPISEH